MTFLRRSLTTLFIALVSLPLTTQAAAPIKALMVAGGCCHDYENQKRIISEGISARANVEWTVVHEGSDRAHKVSIYNNKDWASGYDVIVHNECFGGIKDNEFIETIAAPHKAGLPAVMLHCSTHSYRAASTDEWRKCLGMSSYSHEKNRDLNVENMEPEHPIMKDFPKVWLDKKDELYKNAKVWPGITPLAKAYGQDTKKDHVVVWLNTYGSGRIFATTLGHGNATMESPVYLDLVTRGLLWSVDKLDKEGKPTDGYGKLAPTQQSQATQVWTDPAKAKAEDPDFSLQGEYINKAGGLHVLALGQGNFLTTRLPGGLPGHDWDGKSTQAQRLDTAGVKDLLSKQKYRSITRTSPTLGAKPPKNAIVLFDGSNADAWVNGHMDGNTLESGSHTKQKFKSFQMHLEFRVPHKPNTPPSSQDRGNSGIYTFNRYETQVLDSFGIHYYHIDRDDKNKWKKQFEKDLGFGPKSDRTQWCGCFYKFKTPAVNASFPPLTWQTYDITFTAPKFDGKKKTTNARLTVVHNGIKIHDDVELPKGTGAGGGRPEVASEGIYLQGHGNPVRYRNIWIVNK